MITISGRTFNYKEQLKDIGAKWNPAGKYWHVDKLAHTDAEKLRGYGLIVSGMSAEPPPAQPEASPTPKQPDYIAPHPNVSDIQPNRCQGKTAIYGDDETYLNAFGYQNPMTFFGFSDLQKLVHFVEYEAVRHQTETENTRNDGWKYNYVHKLTSSMSDAIALVRDGWQEGITEAEEFISSLDREHAKQKRRHYSVAGGNVNVGRMLADCPTHMIKRARKDGNKIIRIFVDVGMLSHIPAQSARMRAIVIAAAVELAESSGYRCELVAHSACIPTYAKSEVAVSVACVLKQSNEKLDLNSIIFALGHPSFLRRMIFALRAVDSRHRQMWKNMGSSTDAWRDTSVLAHNEFYIPTLTSTVNNEAAKHKGRDAQMRALFNLVTPEHFPIKLATEE